MVRCFRYAQEELLSVFRGFVKYSKVFGGGSTKFIKEPIRRPHRLYYAVTDDLKVRCTQCGREFFGAKLPETAVKYSHSRQKSFA